MELITIQIGEILGGALVLLMVIVGWKVLKTLNTSKQMSQEEIEKNGVQAEAIVLSIQETGMFFDNIPQIKLQMQVLPDKGRNFIAEVKQVLPDFQRKLLHSGSKITVKYDPRNHGSIVISSTLKF